MLLLVALLKLILDDMGDTKETLDERQEKEMDNSFHEDCERGSFAFGGVGVPTKGGETQL